MVFCRLKSSAIIEKVSHIYRIIILFSDYRELSSAFHVLNKILVVTMVLAETFLNLKNRVSLGGFTKLNKLSFQNTGYISYS